MTKATPFAYVSVSDREWERQLAREQFANGNHIPASFRVELDDNDGCMPVGWYLTGLCKNGCEIFSPIRHSYGPFDTADEAHAHAPKIMAAMLAVR